jgi:hypothetical protein
MSDATRRDFLKKAAGAASGAALAGSLGAAGCTPDEPGAGAAGAAGAAAGGVADRITLLDAPLQALAEVALPVVALGPQGTTDAVRDFRAWVEEFEAAAELDHPYLTGELRYGPPHPGPRWAAQLEALELEVERRTGTPFSALTAPERGAIVEDLIQRADSGNLPRSPALADHVVVGLLAWFYGTSRANDLCYGAQVGRHECRGTASLPQEPRPLEEA